MTWGTHCPMCGRVSCSWSRGDECEGLKYPWRVQARDEYDRLPWWKRLFLERPKPIERDK